MPLIGYNLKWALFNFIKVALQGQEKRNSSEESIYSAGHGRRLYMYKHICDQKYSFVREVFAEITTGNKIYIYKNMVATGFTVLT